MFTSRTRHVLWLVIGVLVCCNAEVRQLVQGRSVISSDAGGGRALPKEERQVGSRRRLNFYTKDEAIAAGDSCMEFTLDGSWSGSNSVMKGVYIYEGEDSNGYPYWKKTYSDYYLQLRVPDSGSPYMHITNVDGTLSWWYSWDYEWPDKANGYWRVWTGSEWYQASASEASWTCTGDSFPTGLPTPGPTISSSPTVPPTPVPSTLPTPVPSPVPSLVPSPAPSRVPTPLPTSQPTGFPTSMPTFNPSPFPTPVPSAEPTLVPTLAPSPLPTPVPSPEPTRVPTLVPTAHPSRSPTAAPTLMPSPIPSLEPTPMPSALCIAGQYMTDYFVCRFCPPGQFLTFTRPFPGGWPRNCTRCSIGRFQDNDGQTECKSCFPGKYASRIGSSNCSHCRAGYIAPTRGASNCTSCPKGRFVADYSPTNIQTSCKNCNPGTFQALTGQINCTKCGPGKVSGSAGQASCTACNPGSYVPKYQYVYVAATGREVHLEGTTPQINCTLCTSGTYQEEEGATSCVRCAYGTTSNHSGATECWDCPKHTYNNDHIVQSFCEKCPAGREAPTEGSDHCESCTIGKASSPGHYCENCPPGKFGDVIELASPCKSCSPGYYQPLTGMTACTACSVLGEGRTSESGSAACDICDTNFLWNHLIGCDGLTGDFRYSEDVDKENAYGFKGCCMSCVELAGFNADPLLSSVRCNQAGIRLDELMVNPGWWRASPDTTALVKCGSDDCRSGGGRSSVENPLGQLPVDGSGHELTVEGIEQGAGNGTGDALCQPNSFGPQCRICKPNYFLYVTGTTSVCVVCGESGNFKEMLAQVPVKTWIFFSCIFALAALVLACKKRHKKLKAARDEIKEIKERYAKEYQYLSDRACRICGNLTIVDAMFCRKCGAKLEPKKKKNKLKNKAKAVKAIAAMGKGGGGVSVGMARIAFAHGDTTNKHLRRVHGDMQRTGVSNELQASAGAVGNAFSSAGEAVGNAMASAEEAVSAIDLDAVTEDLESVEKIMERMNTLKSGFAGLLDEAEGDADSELGKTLRCLKICVQAYQIMGTFSGRFFNVTYPPLYIRLCDVMISFVSFDLQTLFPFARECSYEAREDLFFVSLIVYTVFPLLITVLIFGVGAITTLRDWEHRHHTFNIACFTFLFFTFLIFTAVSTKVFEFFGHDEIILQDQYSDSATVDAAGDVPLKTQCVLRADYSTNCDPDNEKYAQMTYYASLMVLIYPMGIPLLYFTLVFRHKHEIHPTLEDAAPKDFERPLGANWSGKKAVMKDPDTGPLAVEEALQIREADLDLVCIGFLFKDYEPQAWWYEVYECVRRLCQTGLNVFIYPGTHLQIATNIFFSFFFIKVHTYFEPYLGWEEDFLSEMSHWLILLQLQVTLLLSTEVISPDGPVGYIFMAITMILFIVVFVIIGSTMKKTVIAAVVRIKELLIGLGDAIVLVACGSCTSSAAVKPIHEEIKAREKEEEKEEKVPVHSSHDDDDEIDEVSLAEERLQLKMHAVFGNVKKTTIMTAVPTAWDLNAKATSQGAITIAHAAPPPIIPVPSSHDDIVAMLTGGGDLSGFGSSPVEEPAPEVYVEEQSPSNLERHDGFKGQKPLRNADASFQKP